MFLSDPHIYSSANLAKSLRLYEYAILIMIEGYWELACAKEASGKRWRSPFMMEPCLYKRTSELTCDLTEFATPATSSSRAIFFSWDHISWTTSSVNISWIEVGIVRQVMCVYLFMDCFLVRRNSDLGRELSCVTASDSKYVVGVRINVEPNNEAPQFTGS